MRTGLTSAIGLLIAVPVALGPASVDAQQRRGGRVNSHSATGDIPSVWQVEFTVRDSAHLSATKGEVLRTSQLNGIRYLVNPLPDMLVRPEALRGTFRMTIDEKKPGTHVDQVWVGGPTARKSFPEAPDKPGVRELLVGRSVKVESCQDLLTFRTEGSRRTTGTPNTFVLSNNLQWTPTIVTSTIYEPPPVRSIPATSLEEGSPILTSTEQEVPYDFRKLVNEGTGYRLPDVNFGGFQQVNRTIDYRIIRKPMQLVYEDPHDLVHTPGMDCATCDPQTENYATEEATYTEPGKAPRKYRTRFLHGNVDIRLKIEGEDVTGFKMEEGGGTFAFNILRIRRDWSWDLGEDDRVKVKAGNKPGTTVGQRSFGNGWIDDPSRVGNFKDMPGNSPYRGRDTPPSKWPRERETKEFLVGVKDFPEFGFLYYSVTIDTKPGAYRVGQSPAEQLTAEEWCSRIGRKADGPLKEPPLGQWVEVPEW